MMPDVSHLDRGTKEGRAAMLWMARRELRLARDAFARGDFAAALDALVYALRVKQVQIPRYYALRREVLFPSPRPRPWWMSE